MKIAFYKGLKSGSSKIDKAVCIATLSQYSHCEIVFSDGLCASASLRDGGVRYKLIGLDPSRWDVFDLHLPAIQEEIARCMFNLHEGSEYDFMGALLALAKIELDHPRSFFCSKICARACGLSGVESPGALLKRLKTLGFVRSSNNFM